jgi:hypothetical protein
MRTIVSLSLIGFISLGVATAAEKAAPAKPAKPAAAAPADAAKAAAAAPAQELSMNATVIEACSCPMFCQCYFSDKPAAHADAHGAGAAGHQHGAGGEHYCKFNNAYKINTGSYGATKLDGAKFWLSGDLGGDFSKGQMDWCVATFDTAVTKEQKDGISAILPHLFPVKWNSFTVAKDSPIDWTATRDKAEAKLGGGKVAEVSLKRFQGMSDEPVVIKNLKYWGAPRNDGFVLMPNEIEAYREGPKAYEYKGTNGFMITIDLSSKDVKG